MENTEKIRKKNDGTEKAKQPMRGVSDRNCLDFFSILEDCRWQDCRGEGGV